MGTIAITVAIVLLVLLLTGSLGAVVIFSLQVIGWIVVALLGLALVANLMEIPSRRAKSLRAKHEMNEKIKRKKDLGYDTTELEAKLELLSSQQPLHRLARRAMKKRIKWGYEDSNEHEA